MPLIVSGGAADVRRGEDAVGRRHDRDVPGVRPDILRIGGSVRSGAGRAGDRAQRDDRHDRRAFLDISGVGALDKIVARLRRDGRTVEVVGYNRASPDIVDRFALHDKTDVEMGVVPH